MTELTRRSMLAGSGTLAAAAAVPAAAQIGGLNAAKPLAGKSFLVTGASSGFGHVGSLHYARLGARVFATMRNLPRPESEALIKVARDEKLDIHVLPLDVLSDDQANAAVAEAEKRNGRPLDVLVNNVGINFGGPVELQDMAATRLIFDTNVFGMQRMIRAALPGMRSRKSGLIVNMSSQQGRVVHPESGLYPASKYAVEALSEQLAYELAQHGIEVVLIQPGGFRTNIMDNRARLTAALVARADAKHKSGYPDFVARAARAPVNLNVAAMADPILVPRNIAEIAAMPAGTRPLRRVVHPTPQPQVNINRVAADTQRMMFAGGPYEAAGKAVLD